MTHSGFIDSDGLQIYYQQSGIGPPMMLAHGWGSDTKSNWLDTGWVKALEDIRTVVSIDVRGHGKSDKPYALEPYSYAEMSHDVLNVMDALNVEKADFMGYSMGAFMGAYLLGHHPKRFNSMVLGGIGDETESSAAQGSVIAEALRATDPATIQTSVGKAVRRFVEANPNSDLESLAFSALKMWPEGYPLQVAGDNIAQADFPVLIVNGEQDYPYVKGVDKFVKSLPHAQYEMLPGCDHLSAVDHDGFKALVMSFLSIDR